MFPTPFQFNLYYLMFHYKNKCLSIWVSLQVEFQCNNKGSHFLTSSSEATKPCLCCIQSISSSILAASKILINHLRLLLLMPQLNDELRRFFFFDVARRFCSNNFIVLWESSSCMLQSLVIMLSNLNPIPLI